MKTGSVIRWILGLLCFPYLFKNDIFTKEKYNKEKTKFKSGDKKIHKEYNKHKWLIQNGFYQKSQTQLS